MWLVDGEGGLWRYAAAALLVLSGCALAQWILITFDLTRISLILLMSVVLTATWLGARPSLFAAALSFACYRLMLMQPDLQARVGATDQIITLTLFTAAALLTGSLAGRVRDTGKRSAALAARNKALFLASRAMSESEDEVDIRAVLRAHVGALAGAPAEWRGEPRAGWRESVMHLEGKEFETLYWHVPAQLNSEDEADLAATAQLMADLAAAAIGRARAASNRAKLESIAQTERLQAALLSSVSHDFRTPLSAILTSASSLRAFDDQFDAATRRDLCVTIEEETERLNQFVGRLLHATRLEAGVLVADIAPFDVASSIAGVARRLRGAREDRIVLLLAPGTVARGDQLLFEHALANVIENALRFSQGQPVTVEARREGPEAIITVSDNGRGVPERELDSIFTRFYRASNNETSGQGSGLGLSIARGLLSSMSGSITARLRPGAPGLEVRLALPAA